MSVTIVNSLVECIAAVNLWFTQIIDATGTLTLVVGFISVCLAARFILQPIIGGRFFSAASDRVKKSRIGEKE